jgi:hypothetical protein
MDRNEKRKVARSMKNNTTHNNNNTTYYIQRIILRFISCGCSTWNLLIRMSRDLDLTTKNKKSNDTTISKKIQVQRILF